MSRRRLAYVIDELEVGGTQRQVVEMSSGLMGRGWQVDVVVLTPILAMASEFQAVGVPVHLVPKQRMVDLPLILALRRFFRRRGVGVVHAFSATAEFFGGVAARLSGCRFVASVRNFDEPLPALQAVSKRLACRLADVVVANSAAGGRRAVAAGVAPTGKLRVVPNGVRLAVPSAPHDRQAVRRSLGCAEDTCLILSVGRLVRAKGYDVTVDVARQVVAVQPRARFVIVGEGPLRSVLARRIGDAGLTESVVLLGERTDVPSLLAAADVYLNTSVSEGMSNSVMEAMAAGLPVLASAVGGTPELIASGETGILFEPGDCLAAAEMLGQLIEGAALRRAVGARARAFVEGRLTTAAMLGKLESLYEALLTMRPAS
jgi:glycosyltransferase involved in cell wall biosynthesis